MSNKRSLTAIVCEGGGQRGIYTAGVLDTFQKQDFNPFELAFGVSAGAQNLLVYCLGLPGYARTAIEELTAAPDFLVLHRCLLGRNMMDLDGYFARTTGDSKYRLPYERVNELCGKCRLFFVATHRRTLRPVYLEPDKTTVFDFLKASSAMPVLYKSGVAIGGQRLIDGGVGDPLPIEQAYRSGARKILVIRTNTAEFAKQKHWSARLIRRYTKRRLTSGLSLNILDMLEHHELAHQRTQAFIQSPPDDLELQIVHPKSPLSSRILRSQPEALLSDYKTGCKDGLQLIRTLESWQEKVV